ncbi:hypothetical protein MXAN_7446 [Myxococcus xanthus DK 1622]|uniref:Uncharacterized protein n=1 Tax=Myxococcus xanthus (strain DK1622) TaxID=246197 RepID=Q1CVM2_MYXXD|nr:hypothetical protein MXAN_7446 [Myxococcus xanthus DK 1622]
MTRDSHRLPDRAFHRALPRWSGGAREALPTASVKGV